MQKNKVRLGNILAGADDLFRTKNWALVVGTENKSEKMLGILPVSVTRPVISNQSFICIKPK
jgi:hypothetical protein